MLPFSGVIGVTVFLLLGAVPGKPAGEGDKLKVEVFRGKVVPLGDILKKYGSELEPDAAPHWLALQTDDGKLYPLIHDAGGRTFYRDKRLLNRPMQIHGRLLPGSQLLQVLQVHSMKDGRIHEVYYWCEVCSIKRFSLEKSGICECCGGPMEFREVPQAK